MNTSTEHAARRASGGHIRRDQSPVVAAPPDVRTEVSRSRLSGTFARRDGRVGAPMKGTVVDAGGAMRRFRRRVVAATAVSALVLLGACSTAEHASSPGAPATPARTSSEATLEPERDLVVDGRHFKVQCAGQGPSVLVISGYGATMQDWGDLPTRLGATTRTCMYDRLGIGDSDVPRTVQTFEDIAADLDGVISALRLTRPVVLVASGFGGPVAVTWAAHHQPDARALVLLDPVPPGFHAAGPSLLPPPDPGDPELTAMFESDRLNEDPRTNLEHLDPRSWAAYDRIKGLDVPLWDLVAEQPPRLPAAVDAAKFAAAWKAGQRRLADVSSANHLITAAGADSNIWLWSPDLVESAVAEALTS